MTSTQPALSASTSAETGLGPLLQRLQTANPFLDNRVNGPTPTELDVPDIHDAAFQELTALACSANGERRGIGVLLAGEAGIGKSHLLARLAHWADQEDQACLIYLHNLQASAENLPRSVLRSVLSQLTRGQVRQFVYTPFFQLVLGFVCEAVGGSTGIHPWPRIVQACDALINRMAAEDAQRGFPMDRDVYAVLLRFFRSAHDEWRGNDNPRAVTAVRWLSGDVIDPEAAGSLGLSAGHAVAEAADNQHVNQVLVMLARLAACRHTPFILCFDQVDNLDPDQVGALTRFLEALLDSASNLLVVTAGVKSSLLDFRNRKIIQDSAWDRVAQIEITLQRISVAEARHIVAVRLEQFLRPFQGLPAVGEQMQRDPLFPLGEKWAKEFLDGKIEVRPRDVLNWAREGWRRIQKGTQETDAAGWFLIWDQRFSDGPTTHSLVPTVQTIQLAIDRRVDEEIRSHCEHRARRPDSLPPDPENLCGLLVALVQQCRQADPSYGIEALQHGVTGETTRRNPYGLVVTQRHSGSATPVKKGLVILAPSCARVATNALRRLVQDRRPPRRVLLVVDARRPLLFGQQPTAQGRAFFEELRQRGPDRFRYVELPFAEYCYLDALRLVTGMARSGELEVDLPGGQVRPITEPEVIRSHQRQGRYLACTLLRQILTDERAEEHQS